MARSLRLFNLLLVLLALVLLGALANSIRGVELPASGPSVSPSAKPVGAQAGGAEGASSLFFPSVPPPSHFAVISEKDAFRNPVPEPAKAPAAQKAPPPPPLPTLMGTIFIGEERKAVLKDQKRVHTYTIGQPVAGGTLVKVEADRVVIQRGEAEAEVPLRASIQRVPAPASSAPAAPQAAEEAPTAEAPAPPATAAPAPTPAVQTQPDAAGKSRQQERTTPEERLQQLPERFKQYRNRFRAR